MKVRNGFVSNSSSSSFVLLKSGLSDEVIRQMREWVDGCHNPEAGEGYIYETESTFHGEIDQHVDMPRDLYSKVKHNMEVDW